MNVANLFKNSSTPSDREEIKRLVKSGDVRIEQIVSHGQPSPKGYWYDQPTAEWVVLLRGSATLAMAGDGRIELVAGDFLLIPAHLKHRVERTSKDALWLAVHFQEGPAAPG